MNGTMFIVVVFIVAKCWKQSLKMDVPQDMIGYRICGIFTQYYSAIKNYDFMTFTGKWMELKNIILSEVAQSQRNTHGKYSLISGYTPKSIDYT